MLQANGLLRSSPFLKFIYLLTAYLVDPRQKLNNHLQSKDMVNDLQWDITRQGSPHRPVWYAICLSESSVAVRCHVLISPS